MAKTWTKKMFLEVGLSLWMDIFLWGQDTELGGLVRQTGTLDYRKKAKTLKVEKNIKGRNEYIW